jgi:hypothetical protein
MNVRQVQIKSEGSNDVKKGKKNSNMLKQRQILSEFTQVQKRQMSDWRSNKVKYCQRAVIMPKKDKQGKWC